MRPDYERRSPEVRRDLRGRHQLYQARGQTGQENLVGRQSRGGGRFRPRGVTNELIERAKAIRKNPSDRELDMLMTCGEQETIALLAMALEALSVPAVSRTGWQAGIITDGMHSKARIREVKGGDVRKQLRAGKVVVLAGFQGVNESGDLTTFGRGGSDLSAIAMAGALKAKTCQIFTGVEGVFTADPRIVPNACKMPAINYEELLELASSGSKVMQTRAVEFAQKHNIPFEVRSSFSTKSGTQVKKKVKSLEDTLISGVAIDKNQVRVSVTELPDRRVPPPPFSRSWPRRGWWST